MTEIQRQKCGEVIFSCLISSISCRRVVPRVGFDADVETVAAMAERLAPVFGVSVSKETAEIMAAAAVKKYIRRHPLKRIMYDDDPSEYNSGTICRQAGWVVAKELDKKSGGDNFR